MKTEALVAALADTVAEKNGETLLNTSVKLNAEGLLDALGCKRAEVKTENLSDTLVEVKDPLLFVTLADWPTEVVPRY